MGVGLRGRGLSRVEFTCVVRREVLVRVVARLDHG